MGLTRGGNNGIAFVIPGASHSIAVSQILKKISFQQIGKTLGVCIFIYTNGKICLLTYTYGQQFVTRYRLSRQAKKDKELRSSIKSSDSASKIKSIYKFACFFFERIFPSDFNYLSYCKSFK